MEPVSNAGNVNKALKLLTGLPLQIGEPWWCVLNEAQTCEALFAQQSDERKNSHVVKVKIARFAPVIATTEEAINGIAQGLF